MSYLLSIIIPTRNRSSYCLSAVKQILSLNLPDVQICVQDNSDNNSLSGEISSLGMSNVSYNYHPGILSFVDNFCEAVSLANGEYVCMIGDDDGILPNIIEYTKVVKDGSYDALIPELGMVYFWPSNKDIVANSNNGLLTIRFSSNPIVKKVDNKKALDDLLNNAVQNYTSLDIPRLYHGIVKKEILERIKKRTGKYFDGLTPDMYMAATLALECKNVIRVSDSITISGICPTSGSADSATGKHTGELKDAPHFRGHIDYKWNELIPYFYSVDTIWAETLLHALESYGENDLIRGFNLPLFEAICMKKYPDYRTIIEHHAKENSISMISIILSYIIYQIPRLFFKLIHVARNFVVFGKDKNRSYTIYNIKDIKAAELKILELNN